MMFKRLLTVGLMALLCAGTATAASQLNSVQVTPKANTATVSLRTTGSFAHKEYRPDEHSVLVDLTGVTADPAVERTVALSSAVLKGYKLSSYTSGSGSEVTRLELTLGDGVGVEVNDKSDGLQIVLSSRGSNTSAVAAPVSTPARAPVSSVASSFPSASTSTAVAPPKTAVGDAAKLFRPVPENAVPIAKSPVPPQTAQVVAPRAAEHPPERQAEPSAAIRALTPTTIRNISVQRGHGTLDIVIEGPSNAYPFQLKNPDRLVLDFSNATMRASVKNIAVHSSDVLQVRVGRFQAEPPVIRVVIDLSGPRAFDVVPSASRVIVRVKTDDAGKPTPALQAAPVAPLPSAEAHVEAGRNKSGSASSQNSGGPRAALASPAQNTQAGDVPAGMLAPALQAAPVAPLPSAEAHVEAGRNKSGSSNPQSSGGARAVQASPAQDTQTGDVAAGMPAPALKAAPAPILPSAEVAAGQIKPGSSSLQNSGGAHAAQASPAQNTQSGDVAAGISAPALKGAPVTTLPSAEVAAGRNKPGSSSLQNSGGARAAQASPAQNTQTVDVAAGISAPALKAAPAPTLPSAEVAAGQIKPGSSNPQSSGGARAVQASPAQNTQTGDVALPAANRVSQIRDSRIRDPKVRAGVAAEKMATSPQVGSPPVEMARLSLSAPQQLPGHAAQTSASTLKYTGEPISVNLKDVDLKDFFRLIHEISGLNIVLDPNVKGVVTLVLDDVPWDQALDIVLKNNALDRELQGNVLRIAATDTLRREAVDRRAQSEAVALAVDRQTISRFLSYAKAKDVVPTIKKFLTARGDVISDDRTNALIISDIPSVIPNLDRLISQLDRKSQEVEIEVRVVSATRTFSRDLGFQLGFNWGNGVSTIGGSNPNGSTLGGGTTTSGVGTGTVTNIGAVPVGTLPLFSNFAVPGATTGLSLSNITKSYGIDAILTAAESHNLAKVLSRPRVVTQSNVKAEVKQGVKLPVATPGTGNSIATVSYIDAVLRLSVTPQITSDNTIFLTVDVENTQPSGTLNGNQILTTQQATTQVLVTDGGTVVIGGVIQTTNTVSTSQTPLLGDIPWLGNLFKQRSVKTETDELIFFITPKIIQT